MAATSGGDRCKYCWYCRVGFGDKFHNDGCPDPLFLNRGKFIEEEVADQKRRMSEWEKGRTYGFNDNRIEWWQYRHYSPSFILGYRDGKAEIDHLVELAVQRNYGLDYGDER